MRVLFGLIAAALLVLSASQEPKQNKKHAEQDTTKGKPKVISQEAARSAVSTNHLVIKRMMRTTHRGDHSPLVQLLKSAESGEQPDWGRMNQAADWVTIMGVALGQKPSGRTSDSYADIAAQLQASVKAKDQKRFSSSVQRLSKCCHQCHGSWGGAPR